MTKSIYFGDLTNGPEQRLIDDLIVESIRIYGRDFFYIPRVINNQDRIFDEDPVSTYEKAYLVEMYIKNVDGFNGQGDMLSKFGLEIRDEMTLTIAKTTFNNEVGLYTKQIRPGEGDLIYFPLNKKLWSIRFVEHEAIFYQMGSLQTFDLTCQLFEYAGEKFSTGITEIDILQQSNSLDMIDWSILSSDNFMISDEDGFALLQEENNIEQIDPISKNDFYQTEGNKIIDFTESDPFNEGVPY